MSHFTVLVAADSREQLDERMAPYYEQYHPGDGEEFENAYAKGWVEFDDKRDECLAEWNGGLEIKVVELDNGERLFPWDEQFKQPDPERSGWQITVIPEDAKELTLTPKEFYSSFDEFVEDWHGYKSGERIGYWHNPNAKWDWWSVGGRWNGLLKLKNENGRPDTATRGRPGVMGSLNTDEDRADSALTRDIDWEVMRNEDRDRHEKRHLALHAGLEFANRCETIEDAIAAAEEMAIDIGEKIPGWFPLAPGKLEESYGSNPEQSHDIWPTILDYARHQLAEHYALIERGVDFFMTTYDETRELLLPYDEYMKKYSTPARTYAFVDTEGTWVERGSMGWFGMSHDEDDGYDEYFWKFVESLGKDQRVFVVDCHI